MSIPRLAAILLFSLLCHAAASAQEKPSAKMREYPKDFPNFDYGAVLATNSGETPVKPAKDAKTGFVIGGKNATPVIRRLTYINGQHVADLEKRMRPKNVSTAGFLGTNENLLEVLTSDNDYVLAVLGTTHQELARHLHILGALGLKHGELNSEKPLFVRYLGQPLALKVKAFRGTVASPFLDDTKTNMEVAAKNLDTGATLHWSILVPFLIERYGFYEGHGTPFRVQPQAIMHLLDLETAKPIVTHGPLLGGLSDERVAVWARFSEPGEYHVAYGEDPRDLNMESAAMKATLDRDNTAFVVIEHLKPATTYHYRVEGSSRTVDGSFHTLPDTDSVRDPKLNPRGLFNFKFEFACGNNQTPGQGLGPWGPAFKTMLDNLHGKIDFAILNGDWLYEAERDYPAEMWKKRVGAKELPRHLKIAPTLAGVWENYKSYLERGRNLSDWHRNMPTFFTLDDHEILNDVWGAGQPGIRERRAVFRDVGVQAWHDYLAWSNPMLHKQTIRFGTASLKKGSDVLTDPDADFTSLDLKQTANLHVHWGKASAGVNDNKLDDEPPGNPNAGVFGIVKVLGKNQVQIAPAAYADGQAAYSIGRRNYGKLRVSNCDIYLLDTRSHRDMHDVDDRAKKGISMLGNAQKTWLMNEMKKSDADFHFVVSSVNMMVPHVGGGMVRAKNKDDAWTSFLEEREELIRFWDKLGKPVLVLTGDLHNSFAVKITDNVWEFASGPHNSANHRLADEGDRPANGPFDSFGRKCDIRWSSAYMNDIPREELRHPLYCVVQVNNVFNNPLKAGKDRWVAFPRPQVIFQYYDGYTGELRYAEAIGGK